MNKAFIENTVRDIHVRIWREKTKLWPQGVPEPIDMLGPETAAQVLGVTL